MCLNIMIMFRFHKFETQSASEQTGKSIFSKNWLLKQSDFPSQNG